jgi:hypothetical protein
MCPQKDNKLDNPSGAPGILTYKGSDIAIARTCCALAQQGVL